MTDVRRGPSRAAVIAVIVAAGVIVAAVVIGILTIGGAPAEPDRPPASRGAATTAPPETDPDEQDPGDLEDDVTLSPGPGAVLPEPMRGQEAIDALGDRIEFVARRNGKTVEELKELLLRDKSAEVSRDGFIRYVDTFDDEG